MSSLHMQHSGGYMEAVGLCANRPTTGLESPHNAAPPTETPPPGYMSEDGDPIDPNDNMSMILLYSSSINLYQLLFSFITCCFNFYFNQLNSSLYLKSLTQFNFRLLHD